MLKTHAEFLSGKFPAYPNEEALINPGIHGKRLAEFLQERLPKFGLNTGPLVNEDWGWVVPITNFDFNSFIGCGTQSGEETRFLVFMHPHQPTQKKWLKTIDRSRELQRVSSALTEILAGEPEIVDIRWWSDEEIKLSR